MPLWDESGEATGEPAQESSRRTETSEIDSEDEATEAEENVEINDEDDLGVIEPLPQAAEKSEEQIQEPLVDAQPTAAPSPSALSVGQAEKEANLWVAERLQALIDEVEAKICAAEEAQQPIDAALWEVRRSAIRLIIETIS